MHPNQEQEQEQKINGLEPIWKSQNKANSLIIGVSVGSEHFEGVKFSSLVNAINLLAEKVTHCTIAIGDTLQRHNYRLDGKVSEKDAYAMSMKEGDNWIERNSSILKRLKIPYKTTRWGEWLDDPRYENASTEISTLFEKDSAFKFSVEDSIKAFSTRFRKRHEDLGFDPETIDQEILEQCCCAYLLEECAIIMQLWPKNEDKHCEYLLYPGKMTKALAYAYDKMVHKKDLFKWNKYIIKQKNLISRDNTPVNFEEKIEVIKPYNEQERRFFLTVSAACRSIMASEYLPAEKVEMLSSYTKKIAFFSILSANEAFESISKEGNAYQNNI